MVLPVTMDLNREGKYSLEPAVFDGLPLKKGKIQTGYIQLPFDTRRIPTPISLSNGNTLDSFSVSIVRAVNERLLEEESEALPFGTFIDENRFEQLSATEVMRPHGADSCRKLRHNIAIVGAAWHKNAFKRGDMIDLHQTPVGPIGGVFIHANYVEALLDSRTYPPLSDKVETFLDLLFSGAVAFLLASEVGRRRKVWAVVGLCLLLVFISYIFLQNLGVFFDFFFPVLFLVGHAIFENQQEMRREARGYRELMEERSLERGVS